jgi:hypothetical protein
MVSEEESKSARPDSLDAELSHLRGFPFSEKVDWNRFFNPRMLITPHSQKTTVPNHTTASVFDGYQANEQQQKDRFCWSWTIFFSLALFCIVGWPLRQNFG